jgi:hypothetical protein
VNGKQFADGLPVEAENNIGIWEVGVAILSLEFEPGQQVSDQIDPSQRFVVSPDDCPRRDHRVGASQHLVARSAVVIPMLDRDGVDGARLPLRQRIIVPIL